MISDKVQFIYFFNLQKNNQKNPKKQQHKKTQKQNRIVIIFTV